MVSESDRPNKLREIAAARSQLRDILFYTQPDSFYEMIWSADKLSQGEESSQICFSDYPKDFVAAQPGSQYYIAEWMLENLVNEYFLCNSGWVTKGLLPVKSVDHSKWSSFVGIHNLSRKVSDKQTFIDYEPTSILESMPRLARNQFEWQRGFTNAAYISRNLFLYSDEEFFTYFYEIHQVRLDDFILCLFAVFSQATSSPHVRYKPIIDFLPTGRDSTRRALDLVSQEQRMLHRKAAATYGEESLFDHRRSFLRDYPAIRLGVDHLVVPIPRLLVRRMTSGLYYDFVKRDSLKRKMGIAFERYVELLLNASFDYANVFRETKFSRGPQGDTADFMVISRVRDAALIVECKARRVPLRVSVAASPSRAKEAYTDIAKGIYQVWKSARRWVAGEVDGWGRVPRDMLGIVITLEPWAEIGDSEYKVALAGAHKEWQRNFPGISPPDIPVVPIDIQTAEDIIFRRDFAGVAKFVIQSWKNFHQRPWVDPRYPEDLVLRNEDPFYLPLSENTLWKEVFNRGDLFNSATP